MPEGNELTFDGDPFDEEQVHAFISQHLSHLSAAFREELTVCTIDRNCEISDETLSILDSDNMARDVQNAIGDKYYEIVERRIRLAELQRSTHAEQASVFLRALIPKVSAEDRIRLSECIMRHASGDIFLPSDYDWYKAITNQYPAVQDLARFYKGDMSTEDFYEKYESILSQLPDSDDIE
tara:strand:+ start:1888 stop:2430 length:543 start_codon:yes stop_codon:yes gene_type:complete